MVKAAIQVFQCVRRPITEIADPILAESLANQI